MERKSDEKKMSPVSLLSPQILRRSILTYLLSVLVVLALCFIFGKWSTEGIAAGFWYGSLALVLFGVFILGGNTLPAQLSKLSLPRYAVSSAQPREQIKSHTSSSVEAAVNLLFACLFSGALLCITGLLIKSL